MIIAHSSVVHMPPGHYAKIALVIRHIVGHHRGLKKGEGKCRKPRYPRTRPEHNIRIGNKMKGKLWTEEREITDPDGLLELWTR
jgi:hypothetical protein